MTYVYAITVLSALGGALTVLLLIANRYLADYGPCKIAINDEDPFVVEGGRTLLDELYGEKIFMPSACGGQCTCGFCKVTVREGGGPVLPTELPYLTKDEVADNVRLACQIKVKQDLVIHVPPEFLHVQEFRATVIAAQLVTHDTRTLTLKLIEPADIEFRPGQYVQVRVPSAGEPTFRAYSISSPPSRKSEIELLVRIIPGGLCSAYLHMVEVGDEITFTGPYGEFVLDDEAELICVGGGCGLAPMRSLLRHVREVSPGRKCWLFYGARSDDDVMYLDEFQRLADEMPGLSVHYALSEPGRRSAWNGETGLIHESVAEHLGTMGDRQAFLCGPPKMIEATMKVLEEKRLSKDRIFYDEF